MSIKPNHPNHTNELYDAAYAAHKALKALDDHLRRDIPKAIPPEAIPPEDRLGEALWEGSLDGEAFDGDPADIDC